jgi:nitrogenase molybdenum-iron protein NifN
LLHGSQGCATYIRRYLISHFREPVDIASSSFSEEAAVFGGRSLLVQGIRNVTAQYGPEMVGVASTCLAETIGEDLPFLMREAAEGIARCAALGERVHPQLSRHPYHGFPRRGAVPLRPFRGGRTARPTGPSSSQGFVSPADLRALKETAMP